MNTMPSTTTAPSMAPPADEKHYHSHDDADEDTHDQLKDLRLPHTRAQRHPPARPPPAPAPLLALGALFALSGPDVPWYTPDSRTLPPSPSFPASPALAHSHHIPLIVDNTFGMGGRLVPPLVLGADIIVATTKWIGGHGTTIGGVVIDGGKFDFNAASSSKFPTFTDPAEGYHGLVFSKAFGAETFAVRVRVEMLRSLGPAMNPFAAFLLLQGIEMLSLRATRHCKNAAALAQALLANPHVAGSRTSGSPRTPRTSAPSPRCAEVAFGGVLNFGVKLASNLANLGDAKTLVIHPALTTHGLLSEEEQHASGVGPDLIRDISDIIANFENALRIAFEFDDV
ncbi:Cys/Met metabolism PLP-dependent enzyme-domain-containing protein [Mycena rebaudengoi]|nr:Cys/Met metabolism PLP-dependent enzyme-domain-containing protein [Mycena rebaudengoi]